MKKFFKRISMVPRGLRYKLLISFSLMSVIPLLVCVYLVTVFIFPHLENMGQVSMIVLLSITIAFLGLLLARRMIDPVIDMALETRIIASGDFDRRINVRGEDEVGDLGKSINAITKKIKDHMQELQAYSLKTKEVNIEIQRKVLALSNVLQVGDMIAASTKLEDVLDMVVQKVGTIDEDSFTALFLSEEDSGRMVFKSSHNIDSEKLEKLSFDLGEGYIGMNMINRKLIKIDSSVRATKETREICDIFETKNYLILPVMSYRKCIGFFVIGNRKDTFIFEDDNIELAKVLSKQLGIAIENDMLMKKTKELAIKDELTGLYNEKYIRERLDEEIKRAILYQRPCSFLLFDIDSFKSFREAEDEITVEETLRKVAAIIRDGSTEVSKVGRLGADEFAIVLPEKNKKEAAQLAEDIRKKIEDTKTKSAHKAGPFLTISGSVSENPIDGTSAKELFDKATDAMKRAKQEGKNRIAI